MFSFAGTPPTNLGVQNGRLLPCLATPNCVCSQDSDAVHNIAPLTYSSEPAEAFAALKQVIAASERTRIVTATADYLYAEFTIPVVGFVDDVEFYLDRAANVIQVRSASRLGKSDLGVNRRRIETIRLKLQAMGV